MMTLPFPPTVNTYYRTVNGRMLISREGREYRQAVAELAASENWPKFGSERVSVSIEAWMPDKRRRDLDNLAKPTCDALQRAGLFPDDSQIDDLRILRVAGLAGVCNVSVEEI